MTTPGSQAREQSNAGGHKLRPRRLMFSTVDWLSTLCCQLPTCLLDFDLCTSLFELLLEGLGVRFGHAFLDRLRSAIDQVLGFLEAELGQLTNRLDDLDLLGA